MDGFEHRMDNIRIKMKRIEEIKLIKFEESPETFCQLTQTDPFENGNKKEHPSSPLPFVEVPMEKVEKDMMGGNTSNTNNIHRAQPRPLREPFVLTFNPNLSQRERERERERKDDPLSNMTNSNMRNMEKSREEMNGNDECLSRLERLLSLTRDLMEESPEEKEVRCSLEKQKNGIVKKGEE